MSKAWRAGFHRLVQRFAPLPVGSYGVDPVLTVSSAILYTTPFQ